MPEFWGRHTEVMETDTESAELQADKSTAEHVTSEFRHRLANVTKQRFCGERILPEVTAAELFQSSFSIESRELRDTIC